MMMMESRQTFRGNPKPLAYPRVLPNLPGAAISKIHYTVLDTLKGNGTWDKETYQRNSLLQVALDGSGISPDPEDIFIISDLDEIAKPAFVREMKQCTGIIYPASLVAVNHWYSFNFLNTEKWGGNDGHAGQPTQQQNRATTKSEKDTPDRGEYQNAAWHCRLVAI
jgi:hypothetical protein